MEYVKSFFGKDPMQTAAENEFDVALTTLDPEYLSGTFIKQGKPATRAQITAQMKNAQLKSGLNALNANTKDDLRRGFLDDLSSVANALGNPTDTDMEGVAEFLNVKPHEHFKKQVHTILKKLQSMPSASESAKRNLCAHIEFIGREIQELAEVAARYRENLKAAQQKIDERQQTELALGSSSNFVHNYGYGSDVNHGIVGGSPSVSPKSEQVPYGVDPNMPKLSSDIVENYRQTAKTEMEKVRSAYEATGGPQGKGYLARIRDGEIPRTSAFSVQSGVLNMAYRAKQSQLSANNARNPIVKNPTDTSVNVPPAGQKTARQLRDAAKAKRGQLPASKQTAEYGSSIAVPQQQPGHQHGQQSHGH